MPRRILTTTVSVNLESTLLTSCKLLFQMDFIILLQIGAEIVDQKKANCQL